MAPQVRPFILEDAPALAELTVAAIAITATRAYSVKQVLSWAARHPGAPRFTESAAKGDTILVALADDDSPAAYTLMERDGHIDMLYCHPDHGGKGLASALLAAAEADARLSRITQLYAEASELARPVFERAGFALLHRRDFTLQMGDEEVPIHNYAMEKHLG
jgi:putative acetyltransferase